jgi:Family of unknown function (DUF6496)
VSGLLQIPLTLLKGEPMPSSEIMEEFRKGKLHSGRGGKIVRKKKQAKAILLSYLRKEGRIGPRKNAKNKQRKRVVSKRD